MRHVTRVVIWCGVAALRLAGALLVSDDRAGAVYRIAYTSR
jgi:hypothetical protein